MSRNDELNSRAEMIEDALQEGYAKGRDEGLAEGIIKGKEEGWAEGREEGREEGKATAILQNAKRMKELGIDVETIMKVTGLDYVTISNL
jgi:flagellar biosynthesis/type III secretory pathway protein FliH